MTPAPTNFSWDNVSLMGDFELDNVTETPFQEDMETEVEEDEEYALVYTYVALYIGDTI